MKAAYSIQELQQLVKTHQHSVFLDSRQSGRVLAQISQVDDSYYLTGPRFSQYSQLLLEDFLTAVLRCGQSAVKGVEQLNGMLSTKGLPAEARVFTCTSMADASRTLDSLFAVG